MAKRLSKYGKKVLTLFVLILIIIVLGIILLTRSCSSSGEVSARNTETISSDSAFCDTLTISSAEFTKLSQSKDKSGHNHSAAVSEYSYLEKLILKDSKELMYGIDISGMQIESGKIESGETFSRLLNDRYNVNIAIINELIGKCEGVFDLRDMRVGNNYTVFFSDDEGVEGREMAYLVYEKSASSYVVFETGTPASVTLGEKNVITEERYAEGVINSSLYATIYEEGLSPMLAARLDEIFKWSIDFFSIQPGDSFRVVYEERFIDAERIGVGRIFGAEFIHRGTPYLAVSFTQGDEDGYWDGEGKNLRKNFLLSPLSFSARVSSRFGSRIHPIQGYRKQHNGIDYAAPTGTPVHAVADGTVTARYWEAGGGNVLKIKHSHGLETLYLHLSKFGSNISVGTRVKQGQVVAYSGNTGRSTGPHLHYGVKENGKYINPAAVPSTPTTPIQPESRAAFDVMKSDVISAMEEYRSAR